MNQEALNGYKKISLPKWLFFAFTGERPRQVGIQAPANANPQALRAVIYIKLAIRRASKDAMNAILPEGLLFFTFWRPTIKSL